MILSETIVCRNRHYVRDVFSFESEHNRRTRITNCNINRYMTNCNINRFMSNKRVSSTTLMLCIFHVTKWHFCQFKRDLSTIFTSSNVHGSSNVQYVE